MRLRSLAFAKLASRPHKPGIHAFAIIGGIEAVVRGIALSIYPLLMYRAWGDAMVVSQLYFMVGVLSLMTGLAVPLATRHVPRRFVYSAGASLFVLSACFGVAGGKLTTAALLCHVMGTATVFVCFNAYVLDNVPKVEFGRLESLRLSFGGFGWTVGPVLGVWLVQFWHGAPFLIVALAALVMLGAFWWLRIGQGRVTVTHTGRRNSPNPLAYLRRFVGQPRLVAGWLLPVLRSCGWWVYTVYVGIYAVQNGLGDQVGGVASSVANAGLFMAPLILRWMQRRSLREAVRTGFLFSGAGFVLASCVSSLPWATIAVLMLASFFLVLLDVCAGLPFLMSVKPSQRTEMSAVYSSFRDVSGILTPGMAWLVLQFSPLAGVFAAAGLALLIAWSVAGQLHPQLGVPGASRIRTRSST
jgi:ACDE family multidrug resistance protein